MANGRALFSALIVACAIAAGLAPRAQDRALGFSFTNVARQAGLDARTGTGGSAPYRWKTDERDFAMPVRVGERGKWVVIRPTTGWAVMKTPLKKDAFAVATDLYYVNVAKQ